MGISAALASIGEAIVGLFDIGSTAAVAGDAALGIDAATASAIAGSETIAATATAATAATAATSSLPAWLAAASLGTTIASGVLGAKGAQQVGQAQAQTATYNSKVASENAQVAKENARIASQSGAAQAAIQGQKEKAVLGGILANQAASGVDVSSGSALDVRSSARALGELNVLTVQSNAAREAFGYQVQEAGFEAESQLNLNEAQYAKAAADINEGSTILGAIGNGSAQFARFLQSSGLSLS